MEPKKNPKYDVHRQRGTIFQISLAITLVLIIMAFQWRTPVEKVPNTDSTIELAYSPIEDFIPSTSIENDEPPKRREIKPEKQRPIEFEPVEDKPIEGDDPITPDIDQAQLSDTPTPLGTIEIPKEDATIIFDVVEKMPEPIGGYEAFYNGLSKSLKYPKRASRDEVTGKVYVSFVVNEKSELSEFKILKGIGYGCDEEAIRVIALSKWNAGKQRGRPVKVRMVQAIHFRLN